MKSGSTLFRRWLLVLLLPSALSWFEIARAQPAFTSFNEIRVGGTGGSENRPLLASNSAGVLWVVGTNSSWLFSPRFDLLAVSLGGEMLAAGMNGDLWATLRSRYRAVDWEQEGGWASYRLYIVKDGAQWDSTAELFATGGYQWRTYPGEYRWSDAYDYSSQTNNSRAILAVDMISEEDETGIYRLSAPAFVFAIDLERRSFRKLTATGGEWLFPYNPVRDNMRQAGRYGIPIVTVSPPRRDTMLLYTRTQFNPAGTGTPEWYHRSARFLDWEGNPLSQSIRLDSIDASLCDPSDRVLLGAGGDIFLLRRILKDNSLGLERFSRTGVRLEERELLPSGLRTYPCLKRLDDPRYDTIPNLRKADYQVTPLSGGGYVLAWTQVTGDATTDILVARYDDDFHLLAPPKRVNSDTTGNQYNPALLAIGDSVSIAWIDTRNGSPEVYLRKVHRNQLTHLAESTEGPPRLSLLLYPMPAHGHLQLSISYPTSPGQREETAEMSLWDVRGRKVMERFIPLGGGGEEEIELATSTLPEGYYRIMIRIGSERINKGIIIWR